LISGENNDNKIGDILDISDYIQGGQDEKLKKGSPK
jgi:hypothetical protein